MAEVLQVEVRQSRGKRNSRRMRRAGTIPAVLYGHGEETVSLAVRTDAMQAAVRHGSHVVELAGAVQQSALIRDMQWDVWGKGILHVDFARVSADETIEVVVSVELRGQSPGVKEGGIVEHLVREVEIECKATSVPEKLVVNINHLKLGEAITVADLALPEGAKCHGDPAAIVAHCVLPVAAPEEEEVIEGGEAEPEVIGGRKEEEEGEAE
jgi:large subunit ribosomal protein L25